MWRQIFNFILERARVGRFAKRHEEEEFTISSKIRSGGSTSGCSDANKHEVLQGPGGDMEEGREMSAKLGQDDPKGPGGVLVRLGKLWAPLGEVEAGLGVSWAGLGGSWPPLGGVLAGLGRDLWGSWRVLGGSWEVLACLWRVLGGSQAGPERARLARAAQCGGASNF